jgi:methionine synthase II (cobalamin-independent)
MQIDTEPIGSIPRPAKLLEALRMHAATDTVLDPLYESAVRDTIERFEATGSPVITHGEQRKYHNFWTCCVHGLPNMVPDGFRIPLAAGHARRMPRLTAGPFRYQRCADEYLDMALRYAKVPVKQAVISLPSLFQLNAGDFYVALAGEPDPVRVLKTIRDHVRPKQRVFVGVVAPIDPKIETPELVRDRVLQAAVYIPIEQLGTTDDCGFAPFCDDTSTSSDTAFAKIAARIAGTALAARELAAR